MFDDFTVPGVASSAPQVEDGFWPWEEPDPPEPVPEDPGFVGGEFDSSPGDDGEAEFYEAPRGFSLPDAYRLPQPAAGGGMIVSRAPSPLLQAAELWLSLLQITRSDAVTLSADDPAEGATSAPIVPERGVDPAKYVGEAGLAAIERYWDWLWPLRSSAPARSIAHCEGCGEHWYVAGGSTKAPSRCSMTYGCEGQPVKAFARLSPQAVQRKEEQKKAREARTDGE